MILSDWQTLPEPVLRCIMWHLATLDQPEIGNHTAFAQTCRCWRNAYLQKERHGVAGAFPLIKTTTPDDMNTLSPNPGTGLRPAVSSQHNPHMYTKPLPETPPPKNHATLRRSMAKMNRYSSLTTGALERGIGKLEVAFAYSEKVVGKISAHRAAVHVHREEAKMRRIHLREEVKASVRQALHDNERLRMKSGELGRELGQKSFRATAKLIDATQERVSRVERRLSSSSSPSSTGVSYQSPSSVTTTSSLPTSSSLSRNTSSPDIHQINPFSKTLLSHLTCEPEQGRGHRVLTKKKPKNETIQEESPITDFDQVLTVSPAVTSATYSRPNISIPTPNFHGGGSMPNLIIGASSSTSSQSASHLGSSSSLPVLDNVDIVITQSPRTGKLIRRPKSSGRQAQGNIRKLTALPATPQHYPTSAFNPPGTPHIMDRDSVT